MNAVTVFTLLLAVFTRLGALGVTVERAPLAGSPYERDVYGYPAAGFLACWPGGQPVLYESAALPIEGQVHEYVHALDCADDGLMDGSPCALRRPATYDEAVATLEALRPGVNRWWVWYAWAGTQGPAPVPSADTEWCAMIAILTGSLGR